ncbi:MAG: 2-isopropylmalate synthase, partial [Candidatus Bathyarchaeia archaeon]
MVRRISIFDTTLRDGEQTPGVSLTPEEKVELALLLDELGVDIIEAGFPTASAGEMKAVSMIAREDLRTEVCALARALKPEIDVAIKCEVDSIHTFISTSEVQMKYALGKTPEEVIDMTVESVEYIKDHGLTCEFSPMDATRTEINFLKRVCKAAEEAKADRINIPDTVGIMTPNGMRKLIADICSVVKVPISVHCHNDFGMAVANSLAGVEGGASQVHVTVNGLGERAGNAALEEVVMALHTLYGMETRINTKLIYRTSQLVRQLSGVPVQPNKAIVGENAFAHESGIHTRGVVVSPSTFEPIDPEVVGRKRKIIAGKKAGRHGISAELEEFGIKPTPEQLNTIVSKVKDLGDKGKTVTDADLIAIARSVIGKVAEEEKVIDLIDLAVVTGIKVIPTASVKIRLNGKDYVSAETGVGPVDAAVKAIQKLTDQLVNVRLKEYRLEALTGGSDAVAEVVIKVEDKDGNIISSRAASEDIVMASVEAMINGINKVLL